MSRCTQVIGLNKRAFEYLEKYAFKTPTAICDKCGHKAEEQFKVNVYDTVTGRTAGMFDDGPDLYEYRMLDTTFVREVVQCTPWSSGPCIFLCLVDNHGKRIEETEWTEEEIEQCL